jgi:hypothetical protein
MADAKARDQILADIEQHFQMQPVYASLPQILRDFVEELRQH